jgi:hypothetical protein
VRRGEADGTCPRGVPVDRWHRDGVDGRCADVVGKPKGTRSRAIDRAERGSSSQALPSPQRHRVRRERIVTDGESVRFGGRRGEEATDARPGCGASCHRQDDCLPTTRGRSTSACGVVMSAPRCARQRPTAARVCRCTTSRSPRLSSGDDSTNGRLTNRTPRGPYPTRNSSDGRTSCRSRHQERSTAANRSMDHRLDSEHGTSGAGIAGRHRSPDRYLSSAGPGFRSRKGARQASAGSRCSSEQEETTGVMRVRGRGAGRPPTRSAR